MERKVVYLISNRNKTNNNETINTKNENKILSNKTIKKFDRNKVDSNNISKTNQIIYKSNENRIGFLLKMLSKTLYKFTINYNIYIILTFLFSTITVIITATIIIIFI